MFSRARNAQKKEQSRRAERGRAWRSHKRGCLRIAWVVQTGRLPSDLQLRDILLWRTLLVGWRLSICRLCPSRARTFRHRAAGAARKAGQRPYSTIRSAQEPRASGPSGAQKIPGPREISGSGFPGTLRLQTICCRPSSALQEPCQVVSLAPFPLRGAHGFSSPPKLPSGGLARY